MKIISPLALFIKIKLYKNRKPKIILGLTLKYKYVGWGYKAVDNLPATLEQEGRVPEEDPSSTQKPCF